MITNSIVHLLAGIEELITLKLIISTCSLSPTLIFIKCPWSELLKTLLQTSFEQIHQKINYDGPFLLKQNLVINLLVWDHFSPELGS